MMKKTLLAMTSALLLTGTMSFAASAQSSYYDNGDRYDRYDNRSGSSWDRDRDGIANRYARHDRHDNRRYQARHGDRYVAPRGYRYVRYSVGGRLPSNYYGNSYYIDYRPYGLSARWLRRVWRKAGSVGLFLARGPHHPGRPALDYWSQRSLTCGHRYCFPRPQAWVRLMTGAAARRRGLPAFST